jgi:putative ABC transport system permease protein
MFFQWKYADERSIVKGQVGWYVVQINDADQASSVATAIDRQFANTPNETKTDTERQFQSSFASMFGNVSLLLGSIALAVVITTLFVAANTMAMSVRERTTEIAVMRTLGFPAYMIFLFIAGEALLMSVAGGLVGALLARAVVSGDLLAVSSFIPAFGVSGANVAVGVALSAFIGVLAGIVPATMAARLRIVDALRRVA